MYIFCEFFLVAWHGCDLYSPTQEGPHLGGKRIMSQPWSCTCLVL